MQESRAVVAERSQWRSAPPSYSPAEEPTHTIRDSRHCTAQCRMDHGRRRRDRRRRRRGNGLDAQSRHLAASQPTSLYRHVTSKGKTSSPGWVEHALRKWSPRVEAGDWRDRLIAGHRSSGGSFVVILGSHQRLSVTVHSSSRLLAFANGLSRHSSRLASAPREGVHYLLLFYRFAAWLSCSTGG